MDLKFLDLNPLDLADPVQRALAFAVRHGQTDGDHHKAWVIDQIVRALTRCPVEKQVNPYGSTPDGKGFMAIEVDGQGESDEYRAIVAYARAGEDSPETYDWDCGVAP
jgi:hypothetical protein